VGVALPVAKKPKQNHPDSASQQGGVIEISSIRLEPSESTSVYYVNHIEVATTPQDFNVICGRLPGKISATKLEEIKEANALVIEPDVQIVIPVTLVPGLIRILTVQKELYEKIYGIQIKEVERQHG
jgi:hypothetical protein